MHQSIQPFAAWRRMLSKSECAIFRGMRWQQRWTFTASPYWGPFTVSGMQAIPFDACCGIVLTDLSHSWWKLGGQIYLVETGVPTWCCITAFPWWPRTGAQPWWRGRSADLRLGLAQLICRSTEAVDHVSTMLALRWGEFAKCIGWHSHRYWLCHCPARGACYQVTR